jgi:hypothetical protein
MLRTGESVSDEPRGPKTFRTCGACRRRWSTAEEFLDDDGVRVLGLQVAGHLPEANLIVFDCSCGSSVSVLVDRLRFLHPEPQDDQLTDLFGSERCMELCLKLEDWTTCDRPCINSRDRRLLKAVLRRKGIGPSPAPVR